MLFPAPTVIHAEVFARIPDDFRELHNPVNMHGRVLYKIETDAGIETTNVAFGGPDGHTRYINETETETETESGCVLRARLPFAGKTMYSHSAAAASAAD